MIAPDVVMSLRGGFCECTISLPGARILQPLSWQGIECLKPRHKGVAWMRFWWESLPHGRGSMSRLGLRLSRAEKNGVSCGSRRGAEAKLFVTKRLFTGPVRR